MCYMYIWKTYPALFHKQVVDYSCPYCDKPILNRDLILILPKIVASNLSSKREMVGVDLEELGKWSYRSLF